VLKNAKYGDEIARSTAGVTGEPVVIYPSASDVAGTGNYMVKLFVYAEGMMQQGIEQGIVSEEDAWYCSQSNALIIRGMIQDAMGQDEAERHRLQKRSYELICKNTKSVLRAFSEKQ
jgi:hypothetical protein